MSARNPFGTPTLKIRTEELLEAARESDARAVAAESATLRATKPAPSPDADVDVDVHVEPLPPGLDLESLLGATDRDSPPPDAISHESATYPTRRKGDGPPLISVACVVISKEDRSWFELDAMAEVVLAAIDGESTVAEILARLTIPREHALGLLSELGSYGVVEFR